MATSQRNLRTTATMELSPMHAQDMLRRDEGNRSVINEACRSGEIHSKRKKRLPNELTGRESQVAGCLGNDDGIAVPNAKIAEMLGVSNSTVRYHLLNIGRKLNAKGKAEILLALGIRPKIKDGNGMHVPVSRAEMNVLNALADDRGIALSNKEIGDKIFIAPKSVRFHLNNLFRKFGVRSRNELLGYINLAVLGNERHLSGGFGEAPAEVKVTRRENDVLECFVDGNRMLSGKEVAHKLGISYRSVTGRFHSLLSKFNVPDRYELAGMYAEMRGRGSIIVGELPRPLTLCNMNPEILRRLDRLSKSTGEGKRSIVERALDEYMRKAQH